MKGKKKHHPPLISRWLLKKMSYFDDEYSIVGDFDEIFSGKCNEKGRINAGNWYRLQVMKSIPLFFVNYFYWSVSMFKNYLKITFRNIKKQKGYSFINISGLAIGMTCCILMFLWISDELSYDKFHEKAEDIYRLESVFPTSSIFKKWDATPAQLAPNVMKDFPEIFDAVRMHKKRKVVLRSGDRVFNESGFFYASPSIFSVFSFNLKKGDALSCLSNTFSLVISEILL